MLPQGFPERMLHLLGEAEFAVSETIARQR